MMPPQAQTSQRQTRAMAAKAQTSVVDPVHPEVVATGFSSQKTPCIGQQQDDGPGSVYQPPHETVPADGATASALPAASSPVQASATSAIEAHVPLPAASQEETGADGSDDIEAPALPAATQARTEQGCSRFPPSWEGTSGAVDAFVPAASTGDVADPTFSDGGFDWGEWLVRETLAAREEVATEPGEAAEPLTSTTHAGADRVNGAPAFPTATTHEQTDVHSTHTNEVPAAPAATTQGLVDTSQCDAIEEPGLPTAGPNGHVQADDSVVPAPALLQTYKTACADFPDADKPSAPPALNGLVAPDEEAPSQASDEPATAAQRQADQGLSVGTPSADDGEVSSDHPGADTCLPRHTPSQSILTSNSMEIDDDVSPTPMNSFAGMSQVPDTMTDLASGERARNGDWNIEKVAAIRLSDDGISLEVLLYWDPIILTYAEADHTYWKNGILENATFEDVRGATSVRLPPAWENLSIITNPGSELREVQGLLNETQSLKRNEEHCRTVLETQGALFERSAKLRTYQYNDWIRFIKKIDENELGSDRGRQKLRSVRLKWLESLRMLGRSQKKLRDRIRRYNQIVAQEEIVEGAGVIEMD